MSDHYKELVPQLEKVLKELSIEGEKNKNLKKIVRDFKEQIEEVDRVLNDDTDSALEQAVDKAFDNVVDKVDDYIPGASKKFILISTVIMLAIVSGLIYITL